MLSKKFLFLFITILISNYSSADIIGVGQVGDKYIYKINGVVVSVSAGDIISGCVVRIDSGLQCDESFDRIKNSESAIENIEDKIRKFESISELMEKNSSIRVQNEYMREELTTLENKFNSLAQESKKQKINYITIINKRNSIINKLSSKLNSINQR